MKVNFKLQINLFFCEIEINDDVLIILITLTIAQQIIILFFRDLALCRFVARKVHESAPQIRVGRAAKSIFQYNLCQSRRVRSLHLFISCTYARNVPSGEEYEKQEMTRYDGESQRDEKGKGRTPTGKALKRVVGNRSDTREPSPRKE